MFFRHVGLVDEELSPRLRELASTRVLDRARVLGAALRVAYLVSASTTGVLPKTPMVVERGRLVLRFENGFKALAGERVFVRLRQLARLDRARAGHGGRRDTEAWWASVSMLVARRLPHRAHAWSEHPGHQVTNVAMTDAPGRMPMPLWQRLLITLAVMLLAELPRRAALAMDVHCATSRAILSGAVGGISAVPTWGVLAEDPSEALTPKPYLRCYSGAGHVRSRDRGHRPVPAVALRPG